jgi:hypothetical protein
LIPRNGELGADFPGRVGVKPEVGGAARDQGYEFIGRWPANIAPSSTTPLSSRRRPVVASARA